MRKISRGETRQKLQTHVVPTVLTAFVAIKLRFRGWSLSQKWQFTILAYDVCSKKRLLKTALNGQPPKRSGALANRRQLSPCVRITPLSRISRLVFATTPTNRSPFSSKRRFLQIFCANNSEQNGLFSRAVVVQSVAPSSAIPEGYLPFPGSLIGLRFLGTLTSSHPGCRKSTIDCSPVLENFCDYWSQSDPR